MTGNCSPPPAPQEPDDPAFKLDFSTSTVAKHECAVEKRCRNPEYLKQSRSCKSRLSSQAKSTIANEGYSQRVLDPQLAMVKSKRKQKRLEQKLIDIESTKQKQLQQIKQQQLAALAEIKRVQRNQEELALSQQQVSQLQAKNASLQSKNQQLSTNSRNLRINNARLQHFQQSNADYHGKLRIHHDRLQSDHNRLLQQESEVQRECLAWQEEVHMAQCRTLAERRIAQKYANTMAKILLRLQESSSVSSAPPELLLKIYEYMQQLEPYEEQIQGKSIPWDDIDVDDKVVETESKNNEKEALHPVPRRMSCGPGACVQGRKKWASKNRTESPTKSRTITQSNKQNQRELSENHNEEQNQQWVPPNRRQSVVGTSSTRIPVSILKKSSFVGKLNSNPKNKVILVLSPQVQHNESAATSSVVAKGSKKSPRSSRKSRVGRSRTAVPRRQHPSLYDDDTDDDEETENCNRERVPSLYASDSASEDEEKQGVEETIDIQKPIDRSKPIDKIEDTEDEDSSESSCMASLPNEDGWSIKEKQQGKPLLRDS